MNETSTTRRREKTKRAGKNNHRQAENRSKWTTTKQDEIYKTSQGKNRNNNKRTNPTIKTEYVEEYTPWDKIKTRNSTNNRQNRRNTTKQAKKKTKNRYTGNKQRKREVCHRVLHVEVR